MNIPSLDLNHFTKGNSEEKSNFVKTLGEAYENVGFAAIKNHGLSDGLIKDLYHEVQSFFALNDEVKEKYEIPGTGGQRGYTSFGKEHAKDSNTGDLKEFWHFGQYVSNEENKKFQYPKNINVIELPKFNIVGENCYKALENSGLEILRAIALFLELNETFFDDYVKKGNSILRPIHYPPITESPKSAVRAGAHEDINLITLLIGASADGLEILTKSNEWVPVTVLEDHIVVNVGDMLQNLTNGILKSTTHRVVNPPKEKWGSSRYSIPFFLHPVSNMPLGPLPSCVQKNSGKKYESISAGEFLHKRLVEIGLIKE
jgi:isopenicillin N synthase-like dioxygenase